MQTDGQLKTGRDVVIAALLGAEEFGFATAPLVVSGCIMMRVCHLDTCPVGVATQNPELRKRFDGRPEYVVNFMRFIAQEVREYLAELGFRTLAEAVGHAEVLDVDDAVRHWKTEGMDLAPIFRDAASCPPGTPRHRTKAQDHGLEKALDNTLIQLCEGALRSGDKVRLDLPVRNVNRTVGTMLGYELTKAWGGEGLPDDTIDVTLTGSAGQSFGAFVPKRHHPAAGRRRERLLRQGPVRRAAHAAPGPDGAVRGRGEHHRRQRDPLRRHVRRDLRARHRRRAVLRAQLRRAGRRRGRRRPRLRVHDRRQGGRARPRSGATSRPACPAASPTCSTCPQGRVNPEMVDIDPLDDDDREFLRDAVERHFAETESAVAQELLTEWDDAVDRFGKVMPKDFKRVLQGPRGGRARRPRRERGDHGGRTWVTRRGS